MSAVYFCDEFHCFSTKLIPNIAAVSSAITEVTSLVSEAIASVGDVTSHADDVISGAAPAMDSTNETAAQTDTAPNAIYIDGKCCVNTLKF